MAEVSFPGAKGSFASVHTDSREVKAGGLFFALKGHETDGHRFLADALARGAAGIVVERPPAGPVAAEVLVVPDTWAALYQIARRRLEEVAPLVVGITGSNGKTSTKEMLAAILATRFRVLKTEGNLNTETGVPLTILGLDAGHEVLVLEMGMQAAGEIAHLAALASPRIGIVTGIGSVHIEFFNSVEGIAEAKAELVEALPADGLAVLNHDDPLTALIRSHSHAPIVTFGLEGGDFRGDGYTAGTFTIRGVPVRLKVPGRHQARNALAALAVGAHLGVPLEDGARALGEVEIDRRLQSLPAPAGFSVVDDAYNASPESMLAAFEALSEQLRAGRLLAVLGEMRELGPLAKEAHERVGARAREVFDEICVVDVGNGRLLAEAAGGQLVTDKAAAVRWVRDHAGEGDVVLVKASHGVALDEVVAELLRP